MAHAEGPILLAPAAPDAAAAAVPLAPADSSHARTTTEPPAEPGTQQQQPRPSNGVPEQQRQQQYVRIVFIGDGFLMHQIRKMVGLMLAVARKAAPPGCIRAALEPRAKITVPMAPSAGLMLVGDWWPPQAGGLVVLGRGQALGCCACGVWHGFGRAISR